MSLRRDRPVLFRLTQDEYKRLRAACAEKAARNLSEFARAELFARSNEKSQPGPDIGQRLTDIQFALDELLRRLDASPPTAGKPETPNDQE
jgi:hypothetical protein